jgi:ribonuclease P protein component
MKILSTKQFQDFYKNSYKKRSSNYFLLHFSLSSQAEVGLSIPKKIYKQAVKRNKIKRILKPFLKDLNLPSLRINIILTKAIDLKDKDINHLKADLKTLIASIS